MSLSPALDRAIFRLSAISRAIPVKVLRRPSFLILSAMDAPVATLSHRAGLQALPRRPVGLLNVIPRSTSNPDPAASPT